MTECIFRYCYGPNEIANNGYTYRTPLECIPFAIIVFAVLVGNRNILPLPKGAFTYDVSSRGGGGFEMLTVADKGGGGGRGSKPC